MKITSKALLAKALTKIGFELTDANYYPNYRNCSNVDCWTVRVECNGTEYVIEGDTVQEVYDNVLTELM